MYPKSGTDKLGYIEKMILILFVCLLIKKLNTLNKSKQLLMLMCKFRLFKNYLELFIS